MENDCIQPMRIGRIRALTDVRGHFLGLPHGTTTKTLIIKVRSMQRSGTEAIRTQIQPSKQKFNTVSNWNSILQKPEKYKTCNLVIGCKLFFSI